MVEQCCSLTNLLLGETLPGITKDMDLTSMRVPIGVCAGIAPFNFPAMIPLWMFPMGTICGNTYVMKPSERDPSACMALVELLKEVTSDISNEVYTVSRPLEEDVLWFTF